MAADREKVTTPEFRVSFPNVFQARSFQGGEPKFGVSMIFDSGADLSALKAAAKRCVEQKYGSKDKVPPKFKNPFRDGKEKEHLDGYGEGTVFVNATSKQRPGVVDKDLQPVIEPDRFYAGCYARATVSPFCYDTAGNRGVSFGLNNLQFLRDGESFSGRVAAEEDFDAVDAGAWDNEGDSGNGDDFLD